MPVCSRGHRSVDDEFCDVCGHEIGDETVVGASPGVSAAPPGRQATTQGPVRCPACDGELDGRFCEECGHDSLVPAPSPRAATTALPVETAAGPAEPAGGVHPSHAADAIAGPPGGPDTAPGVGTWVAVAAADRAYFDTMMAAAGPDASGIAFPYYCPDRRFPLSGERLTIGRLSRSRGIDPDIDLVGPPEDPGVSHLHALLLAGDDGWSIVDLGSANGTLVDGEPVPPNTPRRLADGARIHLGAWTVIVIGRVTRHIERRSGPSRQ